MFVEGRTVFPDCFNTPHAPLHNCHGNTVEASQAPPLLGLVETWRPVHIVTGHIGRNGTVMENYNKRALIQVPDHRIMSD